jgi:hypothetical protein
MRRILALSRRPTVLSCKVSDGPTTLFSSSWSHRDGVRSRAPRTTCNNAIRIVHVVLVWLKEPGNPDHRARITEATRRFSEIPGVDEVRVGEPLASERPTVDDSFDVGLYMTFPSKEALRNYLAHPEHKAAQRAILQPLVRKAVVYDFADEGT